MIGAHTIGAVIVQVVHASEAGGTLPTTGRAIPILAAGIAIGVALLLRLGKSKLDD